jgi:hypothetical protein
MSVRHDWPQMLRRSTPIALVVAVAVAATWLLMASGPAGATGHSVGAHSRKARTYGFDAPTSAAVAGGRLFVTNGLGNSVTEVGVSDGSYVSRLFARRYQFSHPSAIETVGNDLFVANATGNSLTEFAASGRRHLRVIRGARYAFSDPIALASSGQDLFVLNGTGSITEVSASSGALIGTASGPVFGFDQPTGLAVADGEVFVANSANNTVTVVSAATRGFVSVLSGSQYAFSTPIGVGFDGTNMWVTNQGDSSVTEISPTTLQAIDVLVSSNLPMVGPITYGDGYVFTVSPPGLSPMVSQITPSPASVNWMMCNTNGPYDFNDPQAAVVSGSVLWVVNEGGNSLTEMDAGTGNLIRTVS